MRSMALRAVPLPDPSYESLRIPAAGEVHSLHALMGFLSPWQPELLRVLLERYSAPEERVADLSSGTGAFLLQAALSNRVPCGAEQSALYAYIARALLQPADICQVALALQVLPMTRPIDVSLFTDEFSAFFDLMTFREIFHLRQLVLSGEGFVERFLGLLTLSLLHGPSSSFLSTYSSPYISLDPDAQELLNRRRGQYPTHRAVAPRILKKAAFALRDGVPSRFRKIGSQLNVSQALPWDMPAINTGAVSLSVVNWALLARSCAMDSISDVSLRALEQSKSLKRARIYSRGGQWLREWFAGVDMRDVSVAKPLRDLLNEVLLEAARITRPQGRLVFEFPVEEIRSEVSAIIQQDLARFWHQEALLDYEVPTQQSAAQGGCLIVLRRIP